MDRVSRSLSETSFYADRDADHMEVDTGSTGAGSGIVDVNAIEANANGSVEAEAGSLREAQTKRERDQEKELETYKLLLKEEQLKSDGLTAKLALVEDRLKNSEINRTTLANRVKYLEDRLRESEDERTRPSLSSSMRNPEVAVARICGSGTTDAEPGGDVSVKRETSTPAFAYPDYSAFDFGTPCPGASANDPWQVEPPRRIGVVPSGVHGMQDEEEEEDMDIETDDRGKKRSREEGEASDQEAPTRRTKVRREPCQSASEVGVGVGVEAHAQEEEDEEDEEEDEVDVEERSTSQRASKGKNKASNRPVDPLLTPPHIRKLLKELPPSSYELPERAESPMEDNDRVPFAGMLGEGDLLTFFAAQNATGWKQLLPQAEEVDGDWGERSWGTEALLPSQTSSYFSSPEYKGPRNKWGHMQIKDM